MRSTETESVRACAAYLYLAKKAEHSDLSIRQQTSAYVSIRQHTLAYEYLAKGVEYSDLSIRQHTSAYVSIRQHTSAYVSE
jgi:hypothetical protein